MANRQDIIKASAKLFAANGFSATSVSHISEAVGLSASAGGIYRHFKSKEAIFDAIFDDYFENYTAFLTAVDSNMSSADGVDKRQLARTLLGLALHQAKMSDAVVKIYLKDQNRLKADHIAQAARIRENSVAAFEVVSGYISGNDTTFDAEAVAGILIDSINFRVSNLVPEFGVTEDRYLSALTDLLYSLIGTDDI